jgi:hypothetical protein
MIVYLIGKKEIAEIYIVEQKDSRKKDTQYEEYRKRGRRTFFYDLNNIHILFNYYFLDYRLHSGF